MFFIWTACFVVDLDEKGPLKVYHLARFIYTITTDIDV